MKGGGSESYERTIIFRADGAGMDGWPEIRDETADEAATLLSAFRGLWISNSCVAWQQKMAALCV